MRTHRVVLWGALLMGVLGGSGCDEKGGGPPPPSSRSDAGGGQDGGNGSPTDGGQEPRGSAFACEVARQGGCDAGMSCFFALGEDGGTGSRCFGGPCDPVRQDCPDGQRCTYARGDGGTWRACVEDGTAEEGEPCQLSGASGDMRIDTCKKGLFCTDRALEDGGTAFQCARFCHDTATCPSERECNEVLRLEGTVELPLICGEPSPRCDLLTEDCDSPLSCYPTPEGEPLCASTGSLGEGQPCEFANQCARGSACVRTAGVLSCRPLCRHPIGEPGCASGSCQPLQGHPGVGACAP